jgi:cytochrome bd-type quinol oxidase subunit 2
MATTLEQYGTGSGIAIGAGTGATAASLAGISSEFAVTLGFGIAGGLVVGGFAGRFTEANRNHDNWRSRVAAYTLLVSLLVGSLLGLLTAWTVDGSLLDGMLGGGATGAVFSFLLSGILISAGRNEQQSQSTAQPERTGR